MTNIVKNSNINKIILIIYYEDKNNFNIYSNINCSMDFT